jgi:hypothetical protein
LENIPVFILLMVKEGITYITGIRKNASFHCGSVILAVEKLQIIIKRTIRAN